MNIIKRLDSVYFLFLGDNHGSKSSKKECVVFRSDCQKDAIKLLSLLATKVKQLGINI